MGWVYECQIFDYVINGWSQTLNGFGLCPEKFWALPLTLGKTEIFWEVKKTSPGILFNQTFILLGKTGKKVFFPHIFTQAKLFSD